MTLGFTKSNELFVGRMAMIGWAASLLGGELPVSASALRGGRAATAQYRIIGRTTRGMPLFAGMLTRASQACPVQPTSAPLAWLYGPEPHPPTHSPSSPLKTTCP